MMFAHRTSRRRPRVVWPVFIGCVVLCATLAMSSGRALAVEAPTLLNAEPLKITENGATLQLQINPQGAETSYEVWLECQQATYDAIGCGAVTGGPHEVGGTLPPSSEAQTTTVAIAGLDAGYTYIYRVAASNAAGRTEEEPRLSFETFLQGACGFGGCPYRPSISLASIEGARKEAARVFAEVEAERRAAREREEWKVREQNVAIYAEEAAALRQRQEEEATVRTAPLAHCVVPSLRGETLRAARLALNRAHCRLGRVRRPRRYVGTLRVKAQTPTRGEQLASDAAVAVTLKAPRPRHRPVS
jgi:hypothetical protein